MGAELVNLYFCASDSGRVGDALQIRAADRYIVRRLITSRVLGNRPRRGCLGDHRPQPEPQLRCRQLLIVEKTAKICDHTRISPELASLTRLGAAANTPPEIGDPVIDQLDTGIGQPQQLPTQKAGYLQRSPALG
jgi:hypothetical protein